MNDAMVNFCRPWIQEARLTAAAEEANKTPLERERDRCDLSCTDSERGDLTSALIVVRQIAANRAQREAMLAPQLFLPSAPGEGAATGGQSLGSPLPTAAAACGGGDVDDGGEPAVGKEEGRGGLSERCPSAANVAAADFLVDYSAIPKKKRNKRRRQSADDDIDITMKAVVGMKI